MIISSSTVSMASKRDYLHYEQQESMVLKERAGSAVQLDISKEGKSLMEQMEEYQKEKKEQWEKRHQENMQKILRDGKLSGANSGQQAEGPKTRYELKMEMMQRLLDALQRMVTGGNMFSVRDELKSIRSEYYKKSSSMSMTAGMSVSAGAQAGSNNGGAVATISNKWTKTTVTSAFVTEMENTAFQTNGMVKTADGREITFGVSVEMSRAFCAKYESFTQQDYIMCDPLTINLDAASAELSDMKFLFDLDADGKEEEISMLGKGSGFLALDKNGDGKINDGSELFGTKSGDGFADLAAYDEDGNGWIDEADSIFKDLKVWTKDENGNDKLLSLKEADVGAIYLGNADTQYSLTSDNGMQTNGMIRKTGVYLKESGGAGTVQHVDLAV